MKCFIALTHYVFSLRKFLGERLDLTVLYKITSQNVVLLIASLCLRSKNLSKFTTKKLSHKKL